MARTTSKRNAGTVASTDTAVPVNTVPERADDESTLSYVSRLVTADASAEALDAAAAAILAKDDRIRLRSFAGRVETSWMVGILLAERARRILGKMPTSFDDCFPVHGVTSKGGGVWMDRKYSTLTECWRIAQGHTPEKLTAFVAAWQSSHDGKSPEQVRDYASWCNRSEKVAAKYNTPDALRAQRESSEKAAAKAREDAEARSTLQTALVAAGFVEGFPLDADEWAAIESVDILESVSILAGALASAHRKLQREMEREAAKAAADAETGPQPAPSASTRRARTTVAA